MFCGHTPVTKYWLKIDYHIIDRFKYLSVCKLDIYHKAKTETRIYWERQNLTCSQKKTVTLNTLRKSITICKFRDLASFQWCFRFIPAWQFMWQVSLEQGHCNFLSFQVIVSFYIRIIRISFGSLRNDHRDHAPRPNFVD